MDFKFIRYRVERERIWFAHFWSSVTISYIKKLLSTLDINDVCSVISSAAHKRCSFSSLELPIIPLGYKTMTLLGHFQWKLLRHDDVFCIVGVPKSCLYCSWPTACNKVNISEFSWSFFCSVIMLYHNLGIEHSFLNLNNVKLNTREMIGFDHWFIPLYHLSYLSGTGARAAVGPSCWESRCYRWVQNRTEPQRCNDCRTAEWTPASHLVCCPASETSEPSRNLTKHKQYMINLIFYLQISKNSKPMLHF